MYLNNLRSICFALTAIIFPAFAQSTPESWTPELQVLTKSLTTPRLSPDGKRVVYAVSHVVMTPDKSEYVLQLFLASVDGKENMQITFGEKSSSNAKWSPDGKRIAFLSDRKDSRNKVYVLSFNGGDAQQLTNMKTAVIDFAWSPDGQSIAFVAPDAKSDAEEKDDKGKNDAHWLDENWKRGRLYVVSAAVATPSAPRGLTDGKSHVSGGFDWSPDGKLIAFSHSTSPSANDWHSADISLVEVASGKVTPFAASPASETQPHFSPDGKSIAMRVSDVPARWAQAATIQLMSLADQRVTRLPATHDAQPTIARWSNDGKRLYFIEGHGVRTDTSYVDLAGNKIVSLQNAPAYFSDFSVSADGNTLAFVMQSPDRAPEVYVSAAASFAPVQLSRANADAPKLPIGKTEVVRWKSKDGSEIEGLLTYPVNYRAGEKVPLLLNIHGGPAGVFSLSYIAGRGNYPLATFAARGYAVLRPNPRGSSGYGVAFRSGNIKDWGGADYQDLMTGVDHVIKMGVADANRLGVLGWSYGGYMTTWIVTQTNRFKAAVAGAPVTNLMSFTTTADIPGFIPDYFQSQFWDNPPIYQKH
ncbi:MAG: S9 family peptidase, partial [Burkholderiales bacterium]|nr:S9 family peptidase [Burkholderiales bacterium]